MNIEKTKIMQNRYTSQSLGTVNGATIEVEQEYIYLSQTIKLVPYKFDREADRITLGWVTYATLR